jgi:hypothetical protein
MKKFDLWVFAVGLIGVVAGIASGAGDEGRMPNLGGAIAWLNSAPLSAKSLRGRVVLVNFWTLLLHQQSARVATHSRLVG